MYRIAVFIIVLLSVDLSAQHNDVLLSSCDVILDERGEVYVKFERQLPNVQKELYSILSFDHGSDHETSLAYITSDRFDRFLAMDIPFEIVSDYYDRRVDIKMLLEQDLIQRNGACLKTSWDFYPAYEAYLGMMSDFTANFPDICELHSLGTLSSGREILALKITSDVSVVKDKPKFLYTSTMHGDETAGFPLLLRLSDYLLCQYDKQDRIKELVDNVEIWINPLANPDGTYRNDNSTIIGATRGNANNVDLNRNFPDPDDGPNPDGLDYQEETIIFMDFAERERFNLSSNFHGGIEVFSYPWDTYEELPADIEWWLCMGRMYADTVHLHSPAGYFDALDNGVANGFDWYEVQGGRQDYMIYYFGGREFSLELSDQKLLDSPELPSNWEYNYRSLINFLAEANNGLRGVITDSETGEPIVAEVFIEGHDVLNSQVYSKMPFGSYYRYLASGTYSFTYSADDYKEQIITLNIEKGQQLIQDVQLIPSEVSNKNLSDDDYRVWTDDQSIHVHMKSDFGQAKLSLYGLNGNLIFSEDLQLRETTIAIPAQITDGVYLVVIESSNRKGSKKIYF